MFNWIRYLCWRIYSWTSQKRHNMEQLRFKGHCALIVYRNGDLICGFLCGFFFPLPFIPMEKLQKKKKNCVSVCVCVCVGEKRFVSTHWQIHKTRFVTHGTSLVFGETWWNKMCPVGTLEEKKTIMCQKVLVSVFGFFTIWNSIVEGQICGQVELQVKLLLFIWHKPCPDVPKGNSWGKVLLIYVSLCLSIDPSLTPTVLCIWHFNL